MKRIIFIVISLLFFENNLVLAQGWHEGEETYNYGEDEGSDKKEEMSMEDHIEAIEDHLKHLKKDMSFDEDREERKEKGTDFE